MNVTLSVAGIFYTGKLGSPGDFWNYLKSMNEESTGQKVDLELTPKKEVFEAKKVDFIYLKECQALVPGSPFIPNNKMVIRIKLSAVDSWTWGTFVLNE